MPLLTWSSSKYTFPLPHGHRFPIAKYTMLRELNLPKLPEPNDVADALAIALCHYHTGRTLTERGATT